MELDLNKMSEFGVFGGLFLLFIAFLRRVEWAHQKIAIAFQKQVEAAFEQALYNIKWFVLLGDENDETSLDVSQISALGIVGACCP